MKNQGSISYQVIQVSGVRAMSRLRRYTNCLLCGAMISVIRALQLVLVQRQGC